MASTMETGFTLIVALLIICAVFVLLGPRLAAMPEALGLGGHALTRHGPDAEQVARDALAGAEAVALPQPAPPLSDIDWSKHAQVSHAGVAAAIAAAIQAATCHPDFRECPDGTVYMICWWMKGSQSGIVPLVPRAGRWVAKTAYYIEQADLHSLLERHSCYYVPPLAGAAIDWEEE